MKKVKETLIKAVSHTKAEAGGLAVGGALVAGLPSLLGGMIAKISDTVFGSNAYVVKVVQAFKAYAPSIVAPALIGGALNLYGNKPAMKAVGKGIIGAVVVKTAMEVTTYAASKVLPAPAVALKGFVMGPRMGALVAPDSDFGGTFTRKAGQADFGGYLPPRQDFAGDFQEADSAKEQADEDESQMG